MILAWVKGAAVFNCIDGINSYRILILSLLQLPIINDGGSAGGEEAVEGKAVFRFQPKS